MAQQTYQHRWKLAIATVALTLGGLGSAVIGPMSEAIAHGVNTTYDVTRAVRVEATFDSGEPMSNAQIAVYAPDDPETPWLSGLADESGHFLFVPDPAVSGMWEVHIRKAGHGEILYVSTVETTLASDSSSPSTVTPPPFTDSPSQHQTHDLPPLQMAIAGGAVLWGFVGTALFFARGQRH